MVLKEGSGCPYNNDINTDVVVVVVVVGKTQTYTGPGNLHFGKITWLLAEKFHTSPKT